MRYCKLCGRKNINRYNHTGICKKCAKKKIAGSDKATGNVVYGLYNSQDELLYIGVTNSMIKRVAQHHNQKLFSEMKIIRRFDTRPEADAFEIYAINALRPPLNVKLETPVKGYFFDSGDLKKFGLVAESGLLVGRTCLKCDTILSTYNEGKFCRRHQQQIRKRGRK
jgi:hypothetical protein